MNTLKLKINPYNDTNIITVDDRPLSPYSALSNYVNDPFLQWAGRLLETAEKEINDNYRLIVSAEAFETKILHDMQNDYDACRDFITESFQLSYSIEDRRKTISQLLNKYGISVPVNQYRISVYSDVALPLSDRVAQFTDIDKAFLIVTDKRDTMNQIILRSDPVILVLISDRSTASEMGNGKYLWEIESSRLKEVVQCIVDRFVKVPFIVDSAKAVSERAHNIEKADANLLATVTSVDMLLWAEDIGQVEVGSDYCIKINTVPNGFTLPQIRIESSSPSIIKAEGLTLTAVAPGTAFISFYRAEEIIPFDRKAVVAVKTNRVQTIRLDCEKDRLCVGKTRRIGINVFPVDADDVNTIRWKSSNNAVLCVDKEGNVTAIGPGKATITAFTAGAKAQAEVEVMPGIAGVTIRISDDDFYIGQTKPASVSVSPTGCMESEFEWKSSDPSVAVVHKTDRGAFEVQAVGIGKCTLTCTALENGRSATCPIEVKSSFDKKENRHGMLSVAFVCCLAAIICGIFRFTVAAAVIAPLAALFGTVSFFKNKADRVWAVVLILISVLIALDGWGAIDVITVMNNCFSRYMP